MWTVTLGIGAGIAAKVQFGINEGKFEFKWKIGVGKGIAAKVDLTDEAQLTHNGVGIGVEANAEIDVGESAVGISSEIALEYSPDTKQTVGTNEGSITLTGPNSESTSIEFADGTVDIEHNEPKVEFGFEAMIIAGFSGQSSTDIEE